MNENPNYNQEIEPAYNNGELVNNLNGPIQKNKLTILNQTEITATANVVVNQQGQQEIHLSYEKNEKIYLMKKMRKYYFLLEENPKLRTIKKKLSLTNIIW